ncbi:hypothetical protein [Caldifermentibacillus hisashii]|jgi:hypothetical protein|nr:hypothetical protein [Caldifermentibacillus hisashii]
MQNHDEYKTPRSPTRYFDYPPYKTRLSFGLKRRKTQKGEKIDVKRSV